MILMDQYKIHHTLTCPDKLIAIATFRENLFEFWVMVTVQPLMVLLDDVLCLAGLHMMQNLALPAEQ